MSKKAERIRGIIMGAIALVILLVYIFRSMTIQLTEGDEYLALASAGYTSTQVVQAPRGEIVDCYGRVFTTNRVSYDIVLDRAYLPSGEENAVLLQLIELMQEYGAEWTDDLPISETEPYTFTGGSESATAALKESLFLNSYASAEEVMYWLKDKYLKDTYDEATGKYVLTDYDETTARRLVGIRYEMTLREFSISNPYTFASDVSSDLATVIEERGYRLTGVEMVTTAKREYVDGSSAPHIIGSTGLISASEWSSLKDEGKTYTDDEVFGYRYNDVVGKSGIELAMEGYLRGTNGLRTITMDAAGNVVSSEDTIAAKAGDTVVLTINKDLQQVASDALEAQIKHLNATAEENKGKEADSGAAIAVDVNTGEILCMVTYPSYDLSTYLEDYSELASDPLLPLLNRATMGAYTVGSIYKPVVAIAGLAEGLINASSTVYCGHVYEYYSDYKPVCLGTHGNINVLNALRVSCNIFFYDLGRRLGIDTINEYAAQFGLGSKTGVEISEVSGQLSSPETRAAVGDTWGPGYTLQSSIGQLDNAFTPIQLAGYVQTLANDGKRMQLHLVKSVMSYDFSETVLETEPAVAQQVDASPEDFSVVREGMIRATYAYDSDGSWLPGTSYGTWGVYRGATWLEEYGRSILVASKTGTPETNTEACNSSFICYAPADDPEIAIIVLIEKGYHGYTGAPVAKAIMEEYFFGGDDYDVAIASGTLIE